MTTAQNQLSSVPKPRIDGTIGFFTLSDPITDPWCWYIWYIYGNMDPINMDPKYSSTMDPMGIAPGGMEILHGSLHSLPDG